jgi:hypothetical protein
MLKATVKKLIDESGHSCSSAWTLIPLRIFNSRVCNRPGKATTRAQGYLCQHACAAYSSGAALLAVRSEHFSDHDLVVWHSPYKSFQVQIILAPTELAQRISG